MKRKDVIKLLLDHGWYLLREGGNHTLYAKAGAPRPIAVKRHREIPELEVRTILKEAGLL
jgi:predicted RNA binding protein YcfA (HicA-like mRNA interferase family)